MGIIEKLKMAGLRGRGGAGFPCGKNGNGKRRAGRNQVCCLQCVRRRTGGRQGGHILEKWPDIVIEGIESAMNEVGAKKSYLYLRQDYFDKFKDTLAEIIGVRPIEIIREPGGYLGGEETALLESIERKAVEPRIKPPFPPQAGLWGCPTLINNLEPCILRQGLFAANIKTPGFTRLPAIAPFREFLSGARA